MEKTTPAPERSSSLVRPLLLAAAAGPALGILSLLLRLVLPPQLVWFTDTASAWCAAVIVLGVVLDRYRPWVAPLAGALMLVVAVVAYYAFVAVASSGPGELLRPQDWLFRAWVWLLAGCVAGPLLTGAGSWIRDDVRWRRLVGIGLLGGVFLADAATMAADIAERLLLPPEIPSPPVESFELVYPALTAGIGILLLLLVPRVRGDRVRALGIAFLLAVFWYVGSWGTEYLMHLSLMRSLQ